jgi:site-specific DNA recombinase
MVAEYERARILERSRRGKLHAARNGHVNVLCGARYGYRYITAQEGGGEARYEIVFEHARVVRQIFEWMGVEGRSIGEICRRLQAQGTPSPKGKSYWDRTTVWGMLKNPAYNGLAAFGKTRIGERKKSLRPQRGQGEQPKRAYSIHGVPQNEWASIPVPALVKEEVFEAVQGQLAENRKRSRANKKGAKHLLQGLIKCGCCGYAYYGKPISFSAAKGRKRSYAYYRCIGTDAYRFGGQRVCDNHQVRTDTLDDAVWSDVRNVLEQPERMEREYTRRLKRPRKQQDQKQLQAGLARIQRGITRLLDAYTEGWMTKQEFEPRMSRLRERNDQLEKQISDLREHESQQEGLRLVIGQLQEFSEKVKEGLAKADWNSKREMIRALVKRVEVGEEAVKVVYRVDPGPFEGGPERGRMQHCWRGDHPALRRTLFGVVYLPLFQHACIQPLIDQAPNHSILDPQVEEASEPRMIQSVETLA